jgi:hypothetical protein
MNKHPPFTTSIEYFYNKNYAGTNSITTIILIIQCLHLSVEL